MLISPVKHLSRFVAAAAAASLTLAPVAEADRGRGRGADDHGRWERRGWDDDDGWRRERRRDHDHYRYLYRDRHDHWRRPVVVYRPHYDYYPRRSVTVTHGHSHGPYHYSGYRPRYDVGHYYSYCPRRTVYISDYYDYGLYDPPHGYHWVRDNDRGDAILASVATGAIIGLFVGALASY